MSRITRIGVWLIIGLIAGLVALVAVAWFLVTTEAGTRQALRLASPWLPDELETGQWSGTLAGPLRIDGLSYESDGVVVSVTEVTLTWTPQRLLAGELAVRELTATGITVGLKATGAAETQPPWEPSDIRLPLNVTVERAALRSLSIVPADPSAARIDIDEALVAGRYDDGGATVDRLLISGPALSVDASATLDPTDDWPATAQARIAYQPPDRPAVNVQVDAAGNTRRVDLVATSDAPWSANIEGHVTDLAGTPAVDLTITMAETVLSTIDQAWPDLRVAGRVGVTGTLADARVTGDASVIPPGMPPVTVAVQANGNREGLVVELLNVRSGESNLTADGEFAFAPPGPTVDLNGRWTGLRWPLGDGPALVTSETGTVKVNGDADRFEFELGGGVGPGRLDLGGMVDLAAGSPTIDVQGRWSDLAISEQPVLTSPEGRLSIKGTVDAYDVVLDTRLAAAPWARGPASLRASGNRTGVTVQSLEAPVLSGRVLGNGSVSWRDAINVTADMSARGVDPSSIWPAIAGQIDVDAALSGTFSDTGTRAVLNVTRVGGTLIEAPLSGRASVELVDRTVELKQLALELSGNTLAVKGTTGAQTNLDWSLEAPDLSVIGAGLSGAVTSTGRIAGAADRLSMAIDIEAEAVESGPVQIENAVGRVVFGDKPGDALMVRVDARGLRIADRDVSTLLLETDGTTGEHSGRLALRSDFGGLSAQLAGGYERGEWSGRIDALRAEPVARQTAWTLDRSAALTISAQAVSLGETCLVQSDASVCADVRWDSNGNGDVAARVTELAIQDFSPWLPPALDYSGTLSGTIALTGNPAGITGDADMRLSPGAVRQRDPTDSDDPALLAWREASISATLATNRLTARAGFELVDAGRLTVDVAVPMIGMRPDAEGPLTGRLEATVTEVPLIETLVPDIDRLRGRFSVNLDLAGSLHAPTVTGSAGLTDAAAELPRLGVALADTRLSVTASGTQVSLEGSSRSGDGTVSIGGDFRLVDGIWRGTGSLTGHRFTAVSLPELRATLSPDLTATIDGRSLLLDGSLVVPSARIEPRDLQGAVRSSPDAIVVDPADTSSGAEEPWQVTSRVRVTLGEDVTIDAFGLEGKIRGSLMVEDKPGKPSTGIGEVSVLDATLTAYSQKLDVERGRMIFTGGPLSSPGVDIRATRSVGDVVVGVDMRGPLSQPEATLFSTPAMNQTEVLSYLVLGRPLSTATPGDQGALGQASLRLGLSGAEFLAQGVGQRIGLDAVEIRDTDTESDTALVVGKYLSPRLYLSYGLGLFDDFNSVLVRYSITDELSVQTESGTEISADIFYTRER